MRLAVLFSGGKDSAFALFKAQKRHEIACLVSIVSENDESFMYHTPNIELTGLQAEAMGYPLIRMFSKGKKEDELKDLKAALKKARDAHSAEGVVTGAVESVYQASRIQRICNELGLWCFNPLWKIDQEELLRKTLESGFTTIISGVFAYPFGNEWLGKVINEETIRSLVVHSKKHGISPSGEGGEIETSVLDAPFFKKQIVVKESEKSMNGENSGVFRIKKAVLADKEEAE